MHLASRNMREETTFYKKSLYKEIMKRTRLRNEFLKDRNVCNKRVFKTKELLCVSS